MMPLTTDQLCRAIPGAVLSGDTTRLVRRVVIDSQEIEPGDLFWALRGTRHDGEAFVDEALARGAVGCVVRTRSTGSRGFLIRVPDTHVALRGLARWYRAQMTATIVGVTGSVGKTTTREMIFSVLRLAGAGTRSRKNYNNHVGLPLSVLDIEPDHRFAVLELGASRPGEIAELAAACSPHVGVVTVVGQAHREGFGSIESVARAKGELLETLPADGVAILNGDDRALHSQAARARCRLVWVGQGETNDVVASDVCAGPRVLGFRVAGQAFSVPVTGRHFITAALCAVAVGREFGLKDQQIAEGLAACQAPPMRCAVESLGGVTLLNDAYNSSPESAQAALELLASWPVLGRKAVVLGDMLELGPDSPALHEQLGARVADCKGVALLIACGEYASDMVRGAVASGLPARIARECRDPRQASRRLADWLNPGDVVLLKASRAMALEKIVAELRRLRAIKGPVRLQRSLPLAARGTGRPLTSATSARAGGFIPPVDGAR